MSKKIMHIKSTITDTNKLKYNISDINQFRTKQTVALPVYINVFITWIVS